MATVGTYEAKTKFTALLKRASKGERITIAKHGVPIATLQAFDGANTAPVRDTIRELKEFRAGRRLNGPTLKSLREDGRR